MVGGPLNTGRVGQTTAVQGLQDAGSPARVRDAAPKPHSRLEAAKLHRSEALDAFKQAIGSFNRDGVGQWAAQAYGGTSATAQSARNALDGVLLQGMNALNRLDQSNAVATTKFAEVQTQGLQDATRALVSLTSAHDRFESARAILMDAKAGPGQRWEAAHTLQMSARDLRQVAKQSLGLFGHEANENLKTLMNKLARTCASGAEQLQQAARKQAPPSAQSLFAQRDGVDVKIAAANERYDQAARGPSEAVKKAVGMELNALLAQRESLNQQIGTALGARPPQAGSARPQAPETARAPTAERTNVPAQTPVAPASIGSVASGAVQTGKVQPTAAQALTSKPATPPSPPPSRHQALREGVALLDFHIGEEQKRLQQAQDSRKPGASRAIEDHLKTLQRIRTGLQEQAVRVEADAMRPQPMAQPKTGLFQSLVPNKLSQILQKSAATKAGQQGFGTVQFGSHLDARAVVAAHIKGVLLRANEGLSRAGVPVVEVPRNQDLRERLQQGSRPKPLETAHSAGGAVPVAPKAASVAAPPVAARTAAPVAPPQAAPLASPAAEKLPIDDLAELRRLIESFPVAGEAEPKQEPQQVQARSSAQAPAGSNTTDDDFEAFMAQLEPAKAQAQAYLDAKQKENDPIVFKALQQLEQADRRNAIFASAQDSSGDAALMQELDALESELRKAQ